MGALQSIICLLFLFVCNALFLKKYLIKTIMPFTISNINCPSMFSLYSANIQLIVVWNENDQYLLSIQFDIDGSLAQLLYRFQRELLLKLVCLNTHEHGLWVSSVIRWDSLGWWWCVGGVGPYWDIPFGPAFIVVLPSSWIVLLGGDCS